MPFHEYQCEAGHVTEKFFKSFAAAEGVEEIDCTVCSAKAKRIISQILGFALYGDPAGYHKPSPTKRHSTKLVSSKIGNKYA